MHIRVSGRNEKVSNKEVHYAAQWMLNRITNGRMSKNVSIFIKNIRKSMDLHGHEMIGNCIWIDDNNRPREFAIEINANKSRNVQLTALAHELVHVKQYMRGELKSLVATPSISKWQGKRIDESRLSYWELPWEIEAYGREHGLLLLYRQHLKDQRLRFPLAIKS
jgi:hypothetical protein